MRPISHFRNCFLGAFFVFSPASPGYYLGIAKEQLAIRS